MLEIELQVIRILMILIILKLNIDLF